MRKDYKTHVSEKKKEQVAEFIKFVDENPMIGIVNLANLPSQQLNNMRKQLRGKVNIKMGKARLIKIALEKAKSKKQNIEELEKHLQGMPALLFTKENPFSLFKLLQFEVAKTSHMKELINLRNLIIVVRLCNSFVEQVQSLLDLCRNNGFIKNYFAFIHVVFDLFNFI